MLSNWYSTGSSWCHLGKPRPFQEDAPTLAVDLWTLSSVSPTAIVECSGRDIRASVTSRSSECHVHAAVLEIRYLVAPREAVLAPRRRSQSYDEDLVDQGRSGVPEHTKLRMLSSLRWLLRDR